MRHLNGAASAPRFLGVSPPLVEPGADAAPLRNVSLCPARNISERDDCGRGEMGNRIKDQQLCLFVDRTSCRTLRANPLRLWFSTLAYAVLHVLRERGLKGTPLATARCDTIRTKLLKIGAAVTVTVHQVWVRLASACPLPEGLRARQAKPPRLGPAPRITAAVRLTAATRIAPATGTHRAAARRRNELTAHRHAATTRVRIHPPPDRDPRRPRSQ